MLYEIPFRKYTSQPSLLVEIPDDTPAEQRMRVAVETAVRQRDLFYKDLCYVAVQKRYMPTLVKAWLDGSLEAS